MMINEFIIFPIGGCTLIAIASGRAWRDECLSFGYGRIMKALYGSWRRSLGTAQATILGGFILSLILEHSEPIWNLVALIMFQGMFWLVAPIFLNFKIGDRYYVNVYWSLAREIIEWIRLKNVKDWYLRAFLRCLVQSRDRGNLATEKVIQYLIDSDDSASRIKQILSEIGAEEHSESQSYNKNGV
jgi:hypothetical protein